MAATGWAETMQAWLVRVAPNPYAQALVLVVVAVLAAWIVERAAESLCRRWARRTKTDLDDRLIEILRRPVFVSMLVIGLGAAAARLPLAEAPAWFTAAALKTIVVVVWTVGGIRLVVLLLDFASTRGRVRLVQPSTVPLFDTVSRVVLVGAAVYFVFLAWDIDVTAWLASAGIVGIAVSFAAKDTLANLFAGVFILVDAPYKLGDYVVLDSGERGMVTHIGMRSTRLLTRDDVEVTIPNSVMGNSKITNESGGPHERERIRVRVGVAYGSDVDQVERVLVDIAESHDEVCRDPTPRVRFRSFGDSGLDFELLCWVDEPVLRGRMLHELNRDVYKRFAAEGIEIPYPKRDVYVRELPAGPGGN